MKPIPLKKIFSIGVIFFLAGCTTARMMIVKNSDYAGRQYKTTFVVACAKSPSEEQNIEAAVNRKLRNIGVKAVFEVPNLPTSKKCSPFQYKEA